MASRSLLSSREFDRVKTYNNEIKQSITDLETKHNQEATEIKQSITDLETKHDQEVTEIKQSITDLIPIYFERSYMYKKNFFLTQKGVDVWKANNLADYEAKGSPSAGAGFSIDDLKYVDSSLPFALYGIDFLSQLPRFIPKNFTEETWANTAKIFEDKIAAQYTALPNYASTIQLTETPISLGVDAFKFCDANLGSNTEINPITANGPDGFSFRFPGGEGFKFVGLVNSLNSFENYELSFTYQYVFGSKVTSRNTVFNNSNPSSGIFLNTKLNNSTPPQHFGPGYKTQFRLDFGAVGAVMVPDDDFYYVGPGVAEPLLYNEAADATKPVNIKIRVIGNEISAQVNGSTLQYGTAGSHIVNSGRDEVSGSIAFEIEDWDFDVTNISIKAVTEHFSPPTSS